MAPKSDRPAFPARLAALACALGLSLGAAGAAAQQAAQPPVKIGYIRSAVPPRVPISLIERPAPDDGIAGAKLAIEDNNTTGRFMNQSFELVDAAVSDQQQAADALGGFAAEGIRFLVADLPAELLVPVADRAAESDMLVFNASATDDSLRGEECRAERHPHRAEPGDARRCAGPVPGVEEVDALVPRRRLASGRRGLCRGDPARRQALRRRDRRGARLQGYGRRAHHRYRHGAGAAADPRLHAGRARPPRRRGGRRERGVRRLHALPHLDARPGRRHRRAEAGKLVAGARPVGRHPAAEPLHPRCPPH